MFSQYVADCLSSTRRSPRRQPSQRLGRRPGGAERALRSWAGEDQTQVETTPPPQVSAVIAEGSGGEDWGAVRDCISTPNRDVHPRTRHFGRCLPSAQDARLQPPNSPPGLGVRCRARPSPQDLNALPFDEVVVARPAVRAGPRSWGVDRHPQRGRPIARHQPTARCEHGRHRVT
jgi:hypothetical protein